mmetsp:Transcript_848/g.1783  ORF Transcript_848/g.1783 Transcript_848/m.1783 type:complete len:221 (+) Transcript_848:1618-2280(+)
MQNARIQKHRQIRINRNSTQPRNILARILIQPRPLHPLRHQNLILHQLLHHVRSTHRIQSPLPHRLLELHGIRRLESIIRFGDESSSPFVDQQQRSIDIFLRGWTAIDGVLEFRLNERQETQNVEIEGDFAEDARSLDLDRHVLSVGSESSSVDLSYARGGDGSGGEGGEDGGEVGDAEFGAEDVVGFGGREGRDGVLELAEFEGVWFGEDVGADGKGLA